MVYKKLTTTAIIIAIVAAIVSNVVFATSEVLTNDTILDGTMQVLLFIQKYSWPVITLVFIYALYEFYIIGAEMLEHKIRGQRLIVSIAIFMVLVQCLPLAYAFIMVNQ